MWKINSLILCLILVIGLSFLLFEKGLWLYVDSAWYPLNLERYSQILVSSLNSFSNVSYFWYDSSAQLWPRFLQTLFKILPQPIYYLVFFVWSFFSAFYVLKIFFDRNASFYWALFFAFNPVSLYFLQQVGYLYSYFSINLVLLGIYYYSKSGKVFPLLLFALWVITFPAYGRIIWIYGSFLLLLGLFYWKEIFYIFKKNKYRSFILVFSSIIVSLPFFMGIIYPFLSWEKEYFIWMTNFVSQAEWWWRSLYNSNIWTPFIEAFYPKEIQQSFAQSWNHNIIFKLVSILFFIWIIFLFTLNLWKTKKDNLSIYLLAILFLTIVVIAGAKFFSPELFHAIVYEYYPFIVNNTRWMYMILVPIYGYMIASIFNNLAKKNTPKFWCLILFYICIVIFPLTPLSQNPKTQVINLDMAYYEILQERYNVLWSTIILPQTTLYLDWNPYHIKLNNNVNFKTPFNRDIRRVNNKQSDLSKQINQLNQVNKQNYQILNLKNIIVFKDIIDTSNSTFNWYNWEWLKEKSDEYYRRLVASEFYTPVVDNELYAIFESKNQDIFEFSLYSPSNILKIDATDIEKSIVDIYSKPIIIDSSSFNLPDTINGFTIPESNTDIKIEYKISDKNTTKFLFKAENVDTTRSFLLQLNQTFSKNWKIKWIDKELYDSYTCDNDFRFFTVTNNSTCMYSDGYLWTLKDYIFRKYKSVQESHHFEWNFVWNAWSIIPDDINPSDIWKDALYWVIIYEKQFLYILSIVISIWFIILLVLFSIIQLFSQYLRKKDAS